MQVGWRSALLVSWGLMMCWFHLKNTGSSSTFRMPKSAFKGASLACSNQHHSTRYEQLKWSHNPKRGRSLKILETTRQWYSCHGWQKIVAAALDGNSCSSIPSPKLVSAGDGLQLSYLTSHLHCKWPAVNFIAVGALTFEKSWNIDTQNLLYTTKPKQWISVSTKFGIS